jgi:hypothetical protein
MSPQPSARLYVTIATGAVVFVTSLVLFLLMLFAWRTSSEFAAGKLVAVGMLMVSGFPLVLRGAHHARGGAPENWAWWVLEIAYVAVAAFILLLVLSGPPQVVEDCGLDGKMC